MPRTHAIRIGPQLVLVLLLFLVGSAGGTGAQEKPAPDFAALEQVARDELRATNTPGAAVAVVSGERVVFAKGFGTADVETGAPVTPETLFRMGSTTKMFTAAAPHPTASPTPDRGPFRRPAGRGSHRLLTG